MAGERTLPGLGLFGFWADGSNGWKDQNDENLRKLSVLVQASVISYDKAVPAAPANGSIYLVPSSAGANARSFAIRDNGAWVYIPPAEGMLVYVRDLDIYVTFNGAVWSPFSGSLTDAPSDGKRYVRLDGTWVQDTTGLPALADNANRYLAVNATGDGLVWVDAPTGGGGGEGGIEEAPVDGTPYVRQDGDWVELPEGSGGGGSTHAHQYWRLRINSASSTAWMLMIHEIELRGVIGGPNLVGSGNAFGPYDVPTHANAFDKSPATHAEVNPNFLPQWLAYNFGSPVEIGEVRITTSGNGFITGADIQWSDDNAAWNTEANITEATDHDVTVTMPWAVPPPPAVPSLSGPADAGKIIAADGSGTGYVLIPAPTGGGGGEGGIEEAPADGISYVRQNNSWVPESGGSGGGSSFFRGALVKPSTDQVYASGINTVIRFAAETYDYGGFWVNTDPNVFTVPAGVTKVRLSAQIGFVALPSNQNQFSFSKNGSRDFQGSAWGVAPSGGYVNPAVAFTSGVIEVQAGDKLGILGYSGSGYTLESDSTWFSVEVVEGVSETARVSDLLDTDIPADPAQGDSLIWDDVAKKWSPGVPVVAANTVQGVNKPFRGAMVGFAAPKALGTPTLPILWDQADYDTDALWSAASPGRFTIPAGVKKVRLSASVSPDGAVMSGNNALGFRKNGASFRGGQGIATPTGFTDSTLTIHSPVIPVVPGDFFEARWNTSSSGTKLFGLNSFFAIEIVEVETVL